MILLSNEYNKLKLEEMTQTLCSAVHYKSGIKITTHSLT